MARFLSGVLAWCAALVVCGGAGVPAGMARDMPPHLTERGPLVLGAASLQEALDAAANAWAAKGHSRPVVSLAASSALARQIESGAVADLFISADEEWMDDVANKGMIRKDTRTDLVGNRLVLIAPAASPIRLHIARGFALAAALDAGHPGGRLATGDVNAVPAGIYAKQALVALGVWGQVAQRIVGANSVRAALLFVDRGEAPLGIVYATDARADSSVRVVDVFPDNSHTPIRYPIARLAASTHPEAEGFRRFLLSAQGRAIFRAYGFAAP